MLKATSTITKGTTDAAFGEIVVSKGFTASTASYKVSATTSARAPLSFVSQGMGEVVSREQSAAALRALMAAPDRTSNRHVKSPETVHGQT